MKDAPKDSSLEGLSTPPLRNEGFPEYEKLFEPISSLLSELAHRYNIYLDKDPHDAPSWCLNFSHPEGGCAKVEVFRQGENAARIMGAWTLDDYDSGTRFFKGTVKHEVERDPTLLEGIVTDCLKEIALSNLGEWTQVATGFGEYWSKTWTKDQFEASHHSMRYPVLNLDLLL
jgi:hypothetical protein